MLSRTSRNKIISDRDRNLVSAMVERMLVETEIKIRLRLAAILAEIMQKLEPGVEEYQNYKKTFDFALYSVSKMAGYNKREIIMRSETNAMAYFSGMKCDEEFIFDHDLEEKILKLEQTIDRFLVVVMDSVVLQGSINLKN